MVRTCLTNRGFPEMVCPLSGDMRHAELTAPAA